MTTKNFIAERKLIAEKKETGERINVVVRVGVPYWLDKDERAACPHEWEGLYDNLADAQGVDLLHALQLASDINSMLEILKDKYNFYWPNGEEYFDDE
jgi:hypothetical protein